MIFVHSPIIFIVIEKSGKTLHLLKSNSKPTASDRQRKKVKILGTYGEYRESKKKPAPPNNAGAPPKAQGQPASGSSILQFMAPPPGGKADQGKGKDATMSGK